MLKVFRRALLVCAFGLAAATAAQTYTPKKIRIEGASTDTADLQRIINLQPGPITKEQIEAALQRLSDTDLFTDLRYRVDANELLITVTEASTAQSLPVRYANFVWWQPAELEQMVEARVPLFHGKLPLSGSLTNQVKAALQDILRDKGIEASVDTMSSTDVPHGPIVATSLTITHPEILVGDLHIDGAPPQAKEELSEAQAKFHGEEFALNETPVAVKNGVTEIFHNAGYLDAAVANPSFSPPRKDADRFLIDVNVSLSDAFLYHVSRVEAHGAAPLSDNDLKKSIDIKPGDVARAGALSEQRSRLTEPYRKHGYLDVEAKLDPQKDTGAHTVAYSFVMVPGQQYRVSAIDASALMPEERAAFAKNAAPAPNTLLDEDFMQGLGREIAALHSSRKIVVGLQPDRKNKTVVMVLRYLPAGNR